MEEIIREIIKVWGNGIELGVIDQEDSKNVDKYISLDEEHYKCLYCRGSRKIHEVQLQKRSSPFRITFVRPCYCCWRKTWR